MSEEKQRRIKGKSEGPGKAWLAVLGWSGIFLLRLLLGLVVWAALTAISFSLAGRAHPEAKIVRELPRWFFIVVPLLPVLAIASTTYAPLWRKLERNYFRGRIEVIAATKNLLIPAIALQLYAAINGGSGWGFTNFLVAVGVCFLVTLARDFDRPSQFVMLLIAGAQGIIVCLIIVIEGPLIQSAGWQIKTAGWLGAVPPVVLMVILYRQSRQVLSGGSPDSRVLVKEDGIQ
jgi:hypothetical protein